MNGTEPNKLKPALIGGVAAGVASSIPILGCLNFCCCALVMGGGFLAAYMYLKEAPPQAEAPYGTGAVLGVMAGLFGAVTATLISIPFKLAMSSLGFEAGGIEQIRDALDEAGADVPPELLNFIENFIGGGGLTFVGIITGLLFNLVIYGIFALIGGIIGVAVLHGKVSSGGAPPAYAPPPPPAA